MAVTTEQNSDHGFTPPGIIKVSPAALEFARDFDETVKQRGRWVVTFDWAHAMSVRRGPDELSEDIGACLILGAYKRHQVPTGFTETVSGVEFAVKIPRDVWEKSVHRLIDIDEALLFKLALR